jgi:hypothetical protein
MGDFVPAGSGGLTAPYHISFTPVVNRSPDSSSAHAAVPRLWPPDHRLVPVEIMGVTDPDNDPVTITVTGVTQDEPPNKKGDGNTYPDAVIANGNAQVRAERSGTGNGRVYVISFTADDGRGGFSNGSVVVYVPHHRSQDSLDLAPRRGASPQLPQLLDDGQNFNSLGH